MVCMAKSVVCMARARESGMQGKDPWVARAGVSVVCMARTRMNGKGKCKCGMHGMVRARVSAVCMARARVSVVCMARTRMNGKGTCECGMQGKNPSEARRCRKIFCPKKLSGSG